MSLKDLRIARIELYVSKYNPSYDFIQGMEFFDWSGALLTKIGSFDNYRHKTTVQLRRNEQLVGFQYDKYYGSISGLPDLRFIIARP